MDIRKLQRAIVDGLEDVKAQGIAVFNTEALSPLFERVIIATGTSNRQTKSLAASVRDKVRERGLKVLRTEGEDNGEWIIVDCGAAVVHIMQPAIRDYYRLEELWGDKPVRMKLLARAGQGLVKASEPMDAPPAAPARRKAAAVKAPAKASPKAAAKATTKAATKATTKTPAARSTKLPAAKKAVARRAAAPRQPPHKGGVRTVVAGKAARKNAPKSAVRTSSSAPRRRA